MTSSPMLEVEITEKDCADGVRNNERYCVVATAIMRLQPEATRIEVNINTIRFSMKVDGKTFRLAYRTPPLVKEYIRAFDSGAEAQPMKFTLVAPQVAQKLPTPKGKAKIASFKPQASATERRSIRVFGEKAFEAKLPTTRKAT